MPTFLNKQWQPRTRYKKSNTSKTQNNNRTQHIYNKRKQIRGTMSTKGETNKDKQGQQNDKQGTQTWTHIY